MSKIKIQWVDKSGNNNHLVQENERAQPLLVNNINPPTMKPNPYHIMAISIIGLTLSVLLMVIVYYN